MHEPSIRAPLLLRYPPEVGAGSRASPLLLNVDIAPTLLDFAGVSAASSPDLRRMQGASFRRILAAAATPPHAAVRAAAAAAAEPPAGGTRRTTATSGTRSCQESPVTSASYTRAHAHRVRRWIHGKGGECTGGALAFEGATRATGGGGGEGATSDTGGDGGGDGGDATGGGGGGDAALVPFLGCFELFDLRRTPPSGTTSPGAPSTRRRCSGCSCTSSSPGGAWRLAAAHAAWAAAEEARAGATPRARRRCRREGRGVGDARRTPRGTTRTCPRSTRGSNLNHHHSSPRVLEIPAVTPYYFRASAARSRARHSHEDDAPSSTAPAMPDCPRPQLAAHEGRVEDGRCVVRVLRDA